MRRKAWRRCGAVLSAELIIVLAVMVLGVVWGLTLLRDAVLRECVDLSASIRSLQQPDMGRER